MRILVLAAAATLALTGAAMARESVHHHHHAMHHQYQNTAAPAGEGAAADSISAHDTYMKNLHDSGYNPHNDYDANGIIKSN
jgi:hypothetical protein